MNILKNGSAWDNRRQALGTESFKQAWSDLNRAWC